MISGRRLSRNPPNHARWTRKPAPPVAIWTIRHVLDDLGAQFYRAVKYLIGFGAIDMQMSAVAIGNHRFAKHNDRIVDPVFGVLNRTVGPFRKAQPLAAKNPIQKFEVGPGAIRNEIWRNTCLPLGLVTHRNLRNSGASTPLYRNRGCRS